jgi:hypothetical protein
MKDGVEDEVNGFSGGFVSRMELRMKKLKMKLMFDCLS